MPHFHSAFVNLVLPDPYDGWAATAVEKTLNFRLQYPGANLIYLVMKKHNAANSPNWQIDFDIQYKGRTVVEFKQTAKNNFNGVFAIILTPGKIPEHQALDNEKIAWANNVVGADASVLEKKGNPDS